MVPINHEEAIALREQLCRLLTLPVFQELLDHLLSVILIPLRLLHHTLLQVALAELHHTVLSMLHRVVQMIGGTIDSHALVVSVLDSLLHLIVLKQLLLRVLLHALVEVACRFSS